jgi:hypothetical protein
MQNSQTSSNLAKRFRKEERAKDRMHMTTKPIRTRTLWLYIKDGKPHALGLASTKKYQKFLHPLVETRFSYPISKTWRITNQPLTETLTLVLAYYTDLVKKSKYFPGHYGDWIKTSVISTARSIFLNIDLIGQAAWPKATTAADLGIFVRNTESIYFIGIVRGNPPGLGQPAIIGGIMNVGKVYDSGAYTMLKETKEESNLTLRYEGDLDELRANYQIPEIPVVVEGFEQLDPSLKEMHSTMYYITTVPTTEQDRNPDGSKRVYLAITYAILIDVGQVPLSPNKLKKVFQAGDDAAAIYIQDVTEFFTTGDIKNLPIFGLHHHVGLFNEMVGFFRSKQNNLSNQ